MKDFRVEILIDYHGVPDSVYTQTQVLLDILRNQLDTAKIAVLHEALTCDNPALQKFSEKSISLDGFMEYSFQRWGPHDSYRPMLEMVSDRNLKLQGLDHTAAERDDLCLGFGILMRMHEMYGVDEQEKTIRQFFDSLKYRLAWQREEGFAGRIDEARNRNFGTAVVITSPSHSKRLVPWLEGAQGYGVNVQELEPPLERELEAKEVEINLGYAKKHEISKRVLPPLVPIVVQAFSEIK